MFICIDDNKTINSDHIEFYKATDNNTLLIYMVSGYTLRIQYNDDLSCSNAVSRLDKLLEAEYE